MAPQVKPPGKNNVVEFEIHVVGDTTEETFTGKFKARRKLSPIDRLTRDDLYSRYLGGREHTLASPEARRLAGMLADLGARLVEVPAWWRESAMGETLDDDNVLEEVYEKTLQVELAFLQELKDKAARAQQQLRDQADGAQEA